KIYGMGLPTGLDPGQNNEGFGYATVMTPASAAPATESPTSAVAPAPLHLYLGSEPLKVGGLSGIMAGDTGRLVEQVGAQVPMRVQVCGSQPSRDIAVVVVFDGAPQKGKVIARNGCPILDGIQCNYAWF